MVHAYQHFVTDRAGAEPAHEVGDQVVAVVVDAHASVDTAPQQAGRLLVTVGAHAPVAVAMLVEGVVHARRPLAVDRMLQPRVDEIRITLYAGKRLAEPAFAWDVDGAAVGAKDGAVVEGRLVIRVFVADDDFGAAAAPGQRRRHQVASRDADIAPVVAVFGRRDEAVRPAAVADRTGVVQLDAVAAGLLRIELQIGACTRQRRLAHHIDHATRLLDAVQRRGRSLEHFDALGGGADIARLDRAHAVAQDAARGFTGEPAAHEGILRACAGRRLGDPADQRQGVVERAHLQVFQQGRTKHLDRLRHIHQRLVGAGRRGSLARFIDDVQGALDFDHRRPGGLRNGGNSGGGKREESEEAFWRHESVCEVPRVCQERQPREDEINDNDSH